MQRMVQFCLCLAAVSCSKQGDNEPSEVAVAPIRINEVSAANAHGDTKHATTSDWLELYNAGPALQLRTGAWFLTDDRDDLMKFELPDLTLGEQGHIRIWCDGRAGAEVHANFRLSSKGEWLALVHLEHGRAYIIDSVHYKPQHGGRSVTTSRYPDGAHTWTIRTPGTPGAPNSASLQERTIATTADPALND